MYQHLFVSLFFSFDFLFVLEFWNNYRHYEITDCYSTCFCWSATEKGKIEKCFLGARVWYTSLPIDLDMSLITNAYILNNFGLILYLWRKECYLVKCLKNICGWKCHFWEICRSQGTSFTCDFYAFYQCKPSDWFLHQWNIVAKYAKQWQNLSESPSSASENNQKKIVLN